MESIPLSRNHNPCQPRFPQQNILPPVRIRWPKVFRRPQPSDISSLEVSASSQCSTEDDGGALQPARASISEIEQRPTGCSFYDPERVGSYPPRPKHMLLFTNLKATRSFALEVLEDDENAIAQPEKDLETMDKEIKRRTTTFCLPLHLFDNSDLEIQHPTVDIQEVASTLGDFGI